MQNICDMIVSLKRQYVLLMLNKQMLNQGRCTVAKIYPQSVEPLFQVKSLLRMVLFYHHNRLFLLRQSSTVTESQTVVEKAAPQGHRLVSDSISRLLTLQHSYLIMGFDCSLNQWRLLV